MIKAVAFDLWETLITDTPQLAPDAPLAAHRALMEDFLGLLP